MAKDDDQTPTPDPLLLKYDGRRRKLPDRDTLVQLHVVERLSVEEIARRYQATRKYTRITLHRLGLRPPRSRQPITPEVVATIQRLFDAGMTQKAIAIEVGRAQSVVSQLVRRHGWKRTSTGPERDRRRKLPDHATLVQLYVVEGLTVAEIAQRYQTTTQGTRTALRRANLWLPPATPSFRPRFPDAQVAEIKRLFDEGLTQAQIASAVGRSQSTINSLIHRHRWKRPPLRSGRKPKPKGG